MLRQYQQNVIKDVYSLYKKGIKSVLVYAPTGSGKTFIASQIIADALNKGRKVLFLVHRTRLIEQTIKTLREKYSISQFDIGVISPEYSPAYHCPIQIAMVQTIARRQLPSDIGLVIVDEAHTLAYFEVYSRIVNHYSGGVLACSNCFFLGLSASPWRTKAKEGFCQYFQAIVRAPYPAELIREKHLASARHFGWGGLIDYRKLDSANGDFTSVSLELVCNSEYNAIVVDKFKDLCPNRKTIAFCASVKQAEDLAKKFNQLNIISEVIKAETDNSERNAIYNRFKHGITQMLVSVSVLCEGFDEPSCDAAIIARPTKSKALWVQMCGRALRIFPGKENAYLLDFGDNTKRFGLSTEGYQTPLCPVFKKNHEMPVKECPNCAAVLPIFAQICPHCGFEFIGEEDKEIPDVLPEFGEIFSKEQQKQIGYLRGQLLRAYKAGRNIARVTWLFTEQYGFAPEQHWYKDAIFRRGKSCHPLVRKADQARLFKVLKKANPKATLGWLGEQFRREFGPGYYNFENVITWYDALGIPSSSCWKEIKQVYQKLIIDASPEYAEVLNFCLEDAKSIKLGK